MAAVGFAVAVAHGLWTGPAWLDSGFVSLRYVRSLAYKHTFSLPGQVSPAEGFADPLWTAVLTVLNLAGLHEFRMQPYAGAVLFGCVVALAVFVAARRSARIESPILVACLAAMPTMALASHSGTDDIFAALMTLAAVIVVSADLDRPEGGRSSLTWLGLLSLCGVAPLMIAAGLAFTYRRQRPQWGVVVLVSLSIMSVARMAIFGSLVPQSFQAQLGQLDTSAWLEALRLSPVLVVLSLVGLAVSRRAGERVWPVVLAMLAWVFVGVVGVAEAEDFGAVMVPVLALLALCAGRGLEGLPSRWLGFAGLLAVGAVDLRVAWADREAAAHARTSAFKQARVMTRFLKWRFEDDVTVVTQTAGILPYFYGRSVFDLTGITHAQPVSPEFVLALNAEVMIPQGQIVSVTAERLSMGVNWDWQVVGETHHQHAIQHHKEWDLINIYPIWFNLYMRADLSKYRPDWDPKIGKKK
jgi:hypothetical protein